MPLPLAIPALISTAAGFVTGPVSSWISGAGNFLSGLLGNNEDKSDTGYQKFIQGGEAQGVIPPPRDEIVYWGKEAGWPQDVLNDIFNTYNQSNGTFTHGDWRGIVISTWPITVRLFKGANEGNILSTSDYYQPVGSKNAPIAAVMNQAQEVNSPKAEPGNGQITQQIASLVNNSGIISESNGMTSPSYNEIAANVVKQILSAESKGQNSSLGTTTKNSNLTTGVPWWVWLIGAGLIFFLVSRRKRR